LEGSHAKGGNRRGGFSRGFSDKKSTRREHKVKKEVEKYLYPLKKKKGIATKKEVKTEKKKFFGRLYTFQKKLGKKSLVKKRRRSSLISEKTRKKKKV